MELRLSSSQLRRAAAIQERIESLQGELERLVGGSGQGPASSASRQSSSARGRTAARSGGGGRGRNISSAGLARIAAAQRKRWANYRKKSGKPSSSQARLGGQKRSFSPAALARISRAQKQRWANYRKEKSPAGQPAGSNA